MPRPWSREHELMKGGQTMDWKKILKIVVAVATALLSALGATHAAGMMA